MFLTCPDAQLPARQEMRLSARLIKEAIQFHLEGLKADGAPLPLPNSEIEYIDVTAA